MNQLGQELTNALKEAQEKGLVTLEPSPAAVPFLLEEYVDNLVAFARIKIGMTQEGLAEKLEVSQAYISKIEAQEKVRPKTLQKILSVIKASKKI